MHPPIILLVSANPLTRSLLDQVLQHSQAGIVTASTAGDGLRRLRDSLEVSIVVCDESGGFISSEPLVSEARRRHPPVPVIVLADHGSVKHAVEAIRKGAFDYLVKPVAGEDLRTAVGRALQSVAGPLTSIAAPISAFDQLVSRSAQMQLVKQLAQEVALSDATVLITGESGTGKELLARAIHFASHRSRGPLVALNCAGIPENLLEAELFGYQRGAFTDAKQSKLGRFQLAEGGTLFLDEIGEMSPSAQAKLLRVLEDRTVDPLGDTISHKINIRIVAATNEDLPAHVKSGRFRLDLYYRLNVYQLRIPPLRERPEDIEPILLSFLDHIRRDQGCRISGISKPALEILQRHDWPGNVRELHNVVEWLTITCKDELIRTEHLPPSLHGTMPGSRSQDEYQPSLLAFGLSLQEMEKRLLQEALQKAGGNVSEASRLLKMTRNTLRYRMAKHHLC